MLKYSEDQPRFEADAFLQIYILLIELCMVRTTIGKCQKANLVHQEMKLTDCEETKRNVVLNFDLGRHIYSLPAA